MNRAGHSWAERPAFVGAAALSGPGNLLEWIIVLPFIFLIPSLMFLEVNLGGRLFVSEIFLLLTLPFLLAARGRDLLSPLPMIFIALCFLWLFGQMISDFYRGTAFEDFSRGWAKIVNTALNFLALYLLINHSRLRLIAFALGIALGYVLIYLFNPGDLMEEDPWKFGLGLSVSLVGCAIASVPGVYRSGVLAVGAMLVPVAMSLLENSRSLAGIGFMATAYLLVQMLVSRRKGALPRFSLGRSVMLGGLGIFLALSALQLYGFAAKEGYLGREAHAKYEMQAQGAFGILLGGRAEIYVSLQAIADSPLVGYGSWAKNPYYSNLLYKLENFGYEISSLSTKSGLIPSHSHIFGAWVEGGILSLPFWLWILFLALRTMARLSFLRDPVAPLVAFSSTLMVWDILFSPFGAERRILMPFYVIILMVASDIIKARYVEQSALQPVRAGAPENQTQTGDRAPRRGWRRRLWWS